MTSSLEQRIQAAERDGPVHEYAAGDVLHHETADLPVEMHIVEQRGGKYYQMWHAEDGTERLIHVNLMNGVLKMRFNERHEPLLHGRRGGRIFVFDRPTHRPREMVNFCRLHPNDPDRSDWDLMGLPVCKKPLANPYEVDRHMQKKHSTAWGTIERERTKLERDEDRKAQHVMMQAIGRTAAPTPPTESLVEVPSTDYAKIEFKPMDTNTRVNVSCPYCDFRTWSTTKTKANNKLKKHQLESHGS